MKNMISTLWRSLRGPTIRHNRLVSRWDRASKMLRPMLWLMSPLMILGLQGSLVPGVKCGSAGIHEPWLTEFHRSHILSLKGTPCPSRSPVAFSLNDEGGLYAYWWRTDDSFAWERGVAGDVVQACADSANLYYVTKSKMLWTQPISMTSNSEGELDMDYHESKLVAKAVAQVSAALDHVLFVTTGGELYLIGNNPGAMNQPRLYEDAPAYCEKPFKLLSGVKAAYAGPSMSVVILRDDSLWGVGSEWATQSGLHMVRSGSVTVGKLAEQVKNATVGLIQCLYISKDDKLWAVGGNAGLSPVFVADGVSSVVSEIVANPETTSGDGFYFADEEGNLFSGLINGEKQPSLTRQLLGVSDVVPFNMGILYRTQGVPLFRFRMPYAEDGSPLGSKPESGVSFLTAADYEINLAFRHRVYDGLNHYVLPCAEAGAKPVRRFLNMDSSSQFYTLDDAEAAAGEVNPRFCFGGVVFYAFETQVEGTKPVYRFYSERTGSHFYTIFENEKDWILENVPEHELRLEGIAWYALPPW